METRCCKVCFQTIPKTNRLKIWEYGHFCYYYLFYFFAQLHSAELVLSPWKLSTRWSKQLTPRKTFDLDIKSTHGQPASCRARSMNVNDGREDIRWIRGLGGERLPAASYTFLPNLEKCLFFAIGEESRFFVEHHSIPSRPNQRPITVEYFQAQHPSRANQPRASISDSIQALVTP